MRLELVQGTVDVLVLKTLSRGALHGYSIAKAIEDRTGGVLDVPDAALYQALHRLERKGLVHPEWGLSENNRKAKYYSLTPAGQAQLAAEVATIQKYVGALFSVLELA